MSLMRRMKLLSILPFLALVNCATVVSKSSYPVSFTSNPSGCKVVVRNDKGAVVHQGVTPSSAVLSARGGYFKPASYTVDFSKSGRPAQSIQLTATLDGWYFGNLLVGGLIGMLVIDPSTGAMWSLPENVTANLTPIASLDAPRAGKIRIVDRATLPKGLEKQLVALN